MRKQEEGKKSVRILIENREYTSWTFQDPDTNTECPRTGILANIDPVKHRLFTKDVFCVSSEDDVKIKMVHSLVRTATSLAGVLQLHDNKTYGRTPNNRLLYKCIPDDKRLPAFLVPYDQKIGFSKTALNKYIVFRFFQWDTEKHPYGIIEETLGNVDRLDAFYEYQLYCKSLHTSITAMTHNARIALNRKSNEDYVEQIRRNPDFQIRDFTSDYVFTIDPPNSLDFDDGFSISHYPDPDTNLIQSTKFILRIYIANVHVWLETLGLWNSFSQRVSTIYLPDRRRPMLPTVLSDALCSLQEGHDRFAFVMEIVVDLSGETVQEEVPRFYNANIRVAKNYRYEEPDLLRDPHYDAFLEATQCLDRFDRKSAHTTIANSHDLVAFWMIRMNCYCGRELAGKKTGIFRSAIFTDPGAGPGDDSSNAPNALPLSEDTRRVIRMWNNTTGQYLAYSESAILSHELMNVNTYIHITSPIRRLVDLLNQMIFCSTLLNISLSADASAFLVEWIEQMEYLNTSMRSIRKVQTDCDLLTRCVKDPNIMSGVHEGVMFDRMVKSDGSISYMVYLEKWKMLSRITTRRQDLPNYSRAEFNVFLFEEEDMTRRKIRLTLVDPTTYAITDVDVDTETIVSSHNYTAK